MFRLAAILIAFSSALLAKGERSGDFDYYVMALSWSPNWCELEGNAKGSPQCNADFGWVLHGLWPQFETGWPSYCPTPQNPPSRSDTRAMADIMGTSGLAWHQWNKHGVCSGLSSNAYYALSRQAYDQVTRPAVFRKLPKPISVPASLIEEAWLKSNPALKPDMLTVTCKSNHIQDVRICLTKDLTPRICGRDVIRDCSPTPWWLSPA